MLTTGDQDNLLKVQTTFATDRLFLLMTTKPFFSLKRKLLMIFVPVHEVCTKRVENAEEFQL